jgi:hypothetical protein
VKEKELLVRQRMSLLVLKAANGLGDTLILKEVESAQPDMVVAISFTV